MPCLNTQKVGDRKKIRILVRRGDHQSVPQNVGISRGEGGGLSRGHPEVTREINAEVRTHIGGFGWPEPSPQVNSPPLMSNLASLLGQEKTPQVSETPGNPEVGPAQPPTPLREGDVPPGGRPKGGNLNEENPKNDPPTGSPGVHAPDFAAAG